METLYITHPACHLHDMGKWHPESPLRLDAIADRLIASGLMDFLTPMQARLAGPTDVLRVHSPEYLQQLLDSAPSAGQVPLDPDTVLMAHTMEAAWAAAGAGLSAVDAIMAGQAKTAFCAVRPPGHHARPSQGMGFCFFNNIAVAASYALEKYALERVAIVDFDVHHGNGTEEIFQHVPQVFMCSFYQHPLFPDTRIKNPGPNMLNIPLPAYSDGAAVREVMALQCLPALHDFAPELILISAGFDAHREDDMGGMKLVEADYVWLTKRVIEVAAEHSQGRIISFLEGGYDLSALGRSAEAHIRALGNF